MKPLQKMCKCDCGAVLPEGTPFAFVDEVHYRWYQSQRKIFCKCGCGEAIEGREDKEFLNDTHRKRWGRAQTLTRLDNLIKSKSLPEEYRKAVYWLKTALETSQTLVLHTEAIGESMLETVQELTQKDAVKRAEAEANGFGKERRSLAFLRHFARHFPDELARTEAEIQDGELGETGDHLILSVLATVPGLAIEGDELATDEDDDEEGANLC